MKKKPTSSPARNRTRAARLAAGLVDPNVSITITQRDAIDAEAASLGLSRAATIAKWADSLEEKHARKNRSSGGK